MKGKSGGGGRGGGEDEDDNEPLVGRKRDCLSDYKKGEEWEGVSWKKVEQSLAKGRVNRPTLFEARQDVTSRHVMQKPALCTASNQSIHGLALGRRCGLLFVSL